MYICRVEAHSLSADSGEELFTFVTRAPKYLDAEIEKHRMISSNSSSSRAIPFSKTASRGTFIPTDIRLEKRGMQGDEMLEGDELRRFQAALIVLEKGIGDEIEYLVEKYDIHKQHANRYLEAFRFQDKVLTANRKWFEEFIRLRADYTADPGIQILANMMEECLETSKPKVLTSGLWHIPYITKHEEAYTLDTRLRLSAARCARVSYGAHGSGEHSTSQDISRASSLQALEHWTPFEHQARVMGAATRPWERGVTHQDREGTQYSANFVGFMQYRQFLQSK